MKYLAIILCLFIFGCAPKDKEYYNPAPSSSLNRSDAEFLAYFIVSRNDKLAIIDITPTGSMLPIMDSSSIVIGEKYQGQPLKMNDIVIYNSDNMLIIHRIKEVSEDSVFIVGDNNKYSDGWISKKKIKYRAVMLIYTNGQ